MDDEREQPADAIALSTDAPSGPSRRETLVALTVCACCAATGLMPGVANAAPPDDRLPPPTPGKTDAGPISAFAKDQIYDAFSRTKQFFISRNKGTIVAFSSVCTHRRCIVRKQTDTALKCPCHQAEFNADGVFGKGPAKSSLAHFAVSLDEKQHVIVDTSKSFDERQWDDPAASVKLDAPAATQPT